MATLRDWKVTIGAQVDGVTSDPRFPSLFEAALLGDPEVVMIQFGESKWPHIVSAVVRISAIDSSSADALGLEILRRNIRTVAFEIIGGEPSHWELRVARELFISPRQ